MWEWRSPRTSPSSTSSRQLAGARRLQLAAVLAQLRLDVGVAEPLVDLLLALAERHLAALGVGDAVLGDREAAADRVFAQRHVVGLGAGEVLQQVAEGGRRHDPQVDRDAVVGLGADAVGAGGAGGGDQRVGGEVLGEQRPAPRRWRSGRCPCRSRPSAGPSRRPRPGWRPGARAAPPPAPRRSAAPWRAAAGPAASPALAAAAPAAASTFSSTFGPRPLRPRIFSASAASRRSSSVATPSSS